MKKTALSIITFLFLSLFFISEANNSKKEDKEIIKVLFFELNNDGSFGSQISTEEIDGVTKENNLNNFINKSISILLYYEKGDIKKYFRNTYTENTNAIVILKAKIDDDNYIERKIEIFRINKVKPVGNITYSPSNDDWTNNSKTVTLEGSAAGEDWLVGNSKPSFKCESHGGCNGTFTIKDSAGNELTLDYDIKNIDKVPPTIHVQAYTEIVDGKQKIGYRCTDYDSGCVDGINEKIDYLISGSSKVYCVFDIAGNSSCQKVTAVNSERDYSDDHLAHTNNKRTLFLKCIDDFSGCTSDIVKKEVTKNIHNDSLTIKDNAGNSFTKIFQISKIDKVKPTLIINGLSRFKASDNPNISVNFNDNVPSFQINDYSESGIKEAKIRWNNSCISGNSLIGDDITNGEDVNYTLAGNHILYLCAIDNAGNISELSKGIIIFPGDLDISKSFVSYDSVSDKYANNSDYYNYTLTLRDKFGNPIYGKKINNINQDCINSLNECYTLRTDMKSYLESNYTNFSVGNDSLIEYNYSGLNTNFNGELNFRVRSLSPGEFSNRFKISLNSWDNNYIDNTIQNEYFIISQNYTSEKNGFKKLFYGELKVSNDNGITWDYIPEIGTELLYKLEVKNSTSINPSITIQNFKNYVNVIDKNNTYIQNVSDITLLNSREPQFSASINTSATASGFGNPGIEISDDLGKTKAYISYNFFGNIISYPITSDDLPSFYDPIKISNLSDDNFLGVEIIGLLQGGGKSNFGGLQEDNISSISMSETRMKIRKNAFTQIRNMSSGTILSGIKYIEGNYTINSNPNYETLIIRNGNLIINNDLNTSGSTLGIIVLKDNYNVETDYNVSGNIYVSPNVQNINAILYADGGIISSNNSGVPYISDSPDRTYSLNKQLVLKGSLFTRNTIGGALLAGGNYILPGGSKLLDTNENFNKAMIYDLNYLRRGKNNCEEESLGVCKYKKGAFVIEYDSRIQSNPPKLFSN